MLFLVPMSRAREVQNRETKKKNKKRKREFVPCSWETTFSPVWALGTRSVVKGSSEHRVRSRDMPGAIADHKES